MSPISRNLVYLSLVFIAVQESSMLLKAMMIVYASEWPQKKQATFGL